MKIIYLLLFLPNLISCSTYSQKKTEKLIIDKKLKNKFSRGPHIAVRGGPQRVYIDSVMVYSTDSSTDIEVLINADIQELNWKYLPFDSCNSFFSDDTLMIELRNTFAFVPDKIKVKVINNDYYVYFIKDKENKEFLAIPKSLTFKSRIYKKGQKILGELMFDFLDPETNRKYSFKGPFVCIVE